MKKIYIFMAFMLMATISLKATVHTVSNDNQQPAEWTNLQMACDSASVGDTIYVQGTPTDYGTIHIKKKLHIIGVGIKPTGNYLYGYPSSISTIYLDTVNYISGASGTIIEGVHTSTIAANYGSNKTCQDLIIRRNRIISTISLDLSNNTLIINNIFQGSWISLLYATNTIIMNNIISVRIDYSSSSTIISNNIFINNTAFSNCQSSTITNNIFYYAAVTGSNYCNSSNNMAF